MKSVWTPARRKAMSELMKARLEGVKATNGNGQPLHVSAQIILSVHGQQFTITTAEATGLYRALFPFIDTTIPLNDEAHG